jgi:hypothetical protein
MIDWLGVVENALWLLGCALTLAMLSYADWAAHASHLRLRDYLKRAAPSSCLKPGRPAVRAGLRLYLGNNSGAADLARDRSSHGRPGLADVAEHPARNLNADSAKMD